MCLLPRCVLLMTQFSNLQINESAPHYISALPGIPLESPVLLKYIDLTPEWDTQSEMYFSQLSEPLQSTVRDQVKMLEKKYKQ